MAESLQQATMAVTTNKDDLKLAIAVALLRSKLVQNPPSSNSDPSPSNAQRWKRKAKERKQEIVRLKEDLKDLEDGLRSDVYPQSASCKCYFFNDLGKLSPNRIVEGSDQRFNDVLCRRFLRQVRLKERRKRRANNPIERRAVSEFDSEDEIEQLRVSVDFLADLCDSPCSVKELHFANWAHQAVDFTLGLLKQLSCTRRNLELIEGTISSLILRLVKRMCTLFGDDLHESDMGASLHFQHIIRKIGSISYIGQRVILAVTHRISELAENLLSLDPFEESFPHVHDCMFLMMQLIEFLVSDYLVTWTQDEAFEHKLCEEWVASHLHARKALESMEHTSGLYVIYMDRVTGHLARQAGRPAFLDKLNPELLHKLFC